MFKNFFGRKPIDPTLVIICGGRRTGTTLLSAILSADERTNPLGQEAQILTRIVEAFRWGRVNFDNFGQSYFGDVETYRAFFTETVARFAREAATRISPGGVLILKNPELSMVLLDVASLFPKAKLLAMIRDPRDQIASELEVGARQLAAGMENLYYTTRNMAGFATSYLDYNFEVLELYRQHSERIHIFRYEDLVLRTDEALAELEAATGLTLPYDVNKKWPRLSPQAVSHVSPARTDLYGLPVNGRSVGRYVTDLSVKEVAVIEEICSDFMDKFGYERKD